MILSLFFGCQGGTLPTATITVKDRRVDVEVADDESERALGLMYRDRLGEDAGMLFVYPSAQERSFWMKDTRIPLTIAYLDADGRIVHLADMKPLDTSPVPSGKPAKYALEMNKGWFARHDVKVGDTVGNLPGGPVSP